MPVIPNLALAGVVSFSSRIIASHRAVESESEAPLFNDPLASILAGRTALIRARARAQVSSVQKITALHTSAYVSTDSAGRQGKSVLSPRRLSPTAVRTQVCHSGACMHAV